MWDRHPVRLALVHMVPDVAGQRGLALAPLLARAGLAADETFAGGAIVARAQISTLLQHLAQRAGDPAIGLDLAAAADPARLGVAGHALFAGRTLRECLAALARQMPDLQGGVGFRLQERNGLAHWHHTMADSDPEHAGVLNEGVAGFMAGAFRAIIGPEAAALTVGLPHRAQAPVGVYEDKLGARIAFRSGTGIRLTFDAAWLDRPSLVHGSLAMAGGDADLPGAARQTVAEAVWRDDDALVAAMSLVFQSAALSGGLGLADAASSLGIAPRTLQRRLAGLGTTFEARVDAWRHQQARQRLADAALPIGSIARTLGYSDPAHFVRAFRRWEGRTPIAFRRSALAERGVAPKGN